ncbi:MAG: cytidine deaminase [Eubacteriaceae bacterium]|jgi:cytidine deaminase|nr:cytidine deaminase [Eubacteriaceae bacterium]
MRKREKMEQSTVSALCRMAEEMRGRAYCPYSNYQVGAAILTESQRMFGGCNVENASYPVGVCAERAACAKAVSEGERSFKAIAVAVSGPFGYPCGMCRQFLSEFVSEDIPVYLINGKGEVREESFYSMFPHAFSLEDTQG